MSDVMLYGILRMPYNMAMHSETSRLQFYSAAQSAAAEIERLRKELSETKNQLRVYEIRARH